MSHGEVVETTTEEPGRFGPLRDVFGRVGHALETTGHKVVELVEDVEIPRRVSGAMEALDDAANAAWRRIRRQPATPLSEMTVRELHAMATEREIPGRSSMNKAELIAALTADAPTAAA